MFNHFCCLISKDINISGIYCYLDIINYMFQKKNTLLYLFLKIFLSSLCLCINRELQNTIENKKYEKCNITKTHAFYIKNSSH